MAPFTECDKVYRICSQSSINLVQASSNLSYMLSQYAVRPLSRNIPRWSYLNWLCIVRSLDLLGHSIRANISRNSYLSNFRLSSSSTRWKSRQCRDPFAREARVKGLRSRAAFKLLEVCGVTRRLSIC